MNVDIVQLIGSLGFPIVACIAMYIQNNKLNERHDKEIDQLSELIKDNTRSINNLADLIERGNK